MHRFEYIEFSSEDLKVTNHVGVAENHLDVFGVVSVILRLQVLILFEVLLGILKFFPSLYRQNAILNDNKMIHFVKLRIFDSRPSKKNCPIVIFFNDQLCVRGGNKNIYL